MEKHEQDKQGLQQQSKQPAEKTKTKDNNKEVGMNSDGNLLHNVK